MGMRLDDPTLWKTRQPRKTQMSGANAHATLDTAWHARSASSKGRRPCRSLTGPRNTGWTPLISAWTEIVSVASAMLHRRSPAIACSDGM